MNNPIEAAHQTLINRLGQILPENGYQTDAGLRIKEGWLEDLLQAEDLVYPFIAVQPGQYPAPTGDFGSLQATIARRLVGAVDPGNPHDYRVQLDALYLDMARALIVQPNMPKPWGKDGPYKVTLGAGDLFPPGSGLAIGTLLFPVQMHIIINE